MDAVRFDALIRCFARAGTRRRLVAALAALPLGGMLLPLGDDEAAAERPRDRVQRRTAQRKRQQRNNKKKNTNKKKNSGGLGSSQCGSTDSDCSQDSDCCSSNCFNFACADKVHTCGQGGASKRCLPPANGCAGETCCYGDIACDACCAPGVTQCNAQGACCVPNCAGRQCGPDGCGTGGTCGSCQSGQTCNETTGQCAATCSAQNCPEGCCDAQGRCQFGTSRQACGRNGEICQACPSGETCLGGVCRTVAGTCTGSVATCGQGLNSPCNSNDACTCDVTTDGTTVCRSKVIQCGVACTGNADCGAGRVCVPCLGCAPAERTCAALC